MVADGNFHSPQQFRGREVPSQQQLGIRGEDYQYASSRVVERI